MLYRLLLSCWDGEWMTHPAEGFQPFLTLFVVAFISRVTRSLVLPPESRCVNSVWLEGFIKHTYRFGVVVTACVANHTVANKIVPREEEGAPHRWEQHLLGFRKKPFDGNVAEHGGHCFLERPYHLQRKKHKQTLDSAFLCLALNRSLIGISGTHSALKPVHNSPPVTLKMAGCR